MYGPNLVITVTSVGHVFEEEVLIVLSSKVPELFFFTPSSHSAPGLLSLWADSGLAILSPVLDSSFHNYYNCPFTTESSEGWKIFYLIKVMYSKSLPLMLCMILPLTTSPNSSPTPYPLAHSAAATLASLLSLTYSLRLLPQSPATCSSGTWLALLTSIWMSYPSLTSADRPSWTFTLTVSPSPLLGPHCFSQPFSHSTCTPTVLYISLYVCRICLPL